MGKRIWEFPRQNEVSDTTLFLCADGEQTVSVPGSIISNLNARINTIIAGSSSGKDSELVDMRTLDSAHIYASAGAALRQVWQELTQASVTTYTTPDFMGGVADGTVIVVEKAGWCHISGTVSLNGTVSNWTTILDSDAIPAPQHGHNIFKTVIGWGTSYTRPARMMITNGGKLQVRYGAAFELNFSFTYPID